MSPLFRSSEPGALAADPMPAAAVRPAADAAPDILLLPGDPGPAGGMAAALSPLVDHAAGRILATPPNSQIQPPCHPSRLSWPVLRCLGSGTISTVVVADGMADGWLARPLTQAFGLRVIVHLSATAGYAALHPAIAHADRLITRSRFARNLLARRHGLAAGRIAILPYGVDAMAFTPVAPSDASRPPVVLSVADLLPGSGMDRVLRSLPRLREKLPALRCRIIGDGPDRAALEGLAAELRLGGVVRFLGHLPGELMPAFYADADLFVLPSPGDEDGCTGSTALLHAAAAGLPIVATDGGSTPEIVKEGENGLLAGGNDPEEPADLALLILTNPALARTMGHRGRAVARAHDWAAVAERFLAICDGRA
ncbi:MAG TPA: glycosyltransferase family 4 protein [Geminicoccus sp.]|uniref:glycosyltransferase family 4 protein n=1 Tax=Geminicoccus sp. TaxID=2024832 RepID=UPI002E37E367|nr:glycosyltransferase family 4 protein [Geminicoccus sp.]HEX2529471.1 glycosyltransferase family 4 protein [Geminicoccus sp.]